MCILRKKYEEWSNYSIFNVPYLGIIYLEAVVKEASFSVDIYDSPCEGIEIKELFQSLLEGDYDIIGISIFYYNLYNTERILRFLEKNLSNAFIFIGGGMRQHLITVQFCYSILL